MSKLAIIGAGVAGLAAARALKHSRPDLAVTIYEQSDRLGGRVTTRRRDGYIFDHGAQNLRAPTPDLQRLLAQKLPAEQLRDIGLPVWTFDSTGAIRPGDPAQNAEPKWIYRDGLGLLADMLAAELDVRFKAQITAIRRAPSAEPDHSVVGGRWSVVSSGDHIADTADAVLLTAPAPEAAAILSASELGASVKDLVLPELAAVSYRRCISLALAFARPIERPFYALVNIDRAHPIAWLAREHAKAPERCPPGHSLLMAQMGSQWSLEHWDMPPEQLEPLVTPLVAALLGEDLGAPLWSDAERWPYALPDRGADFVALNAAHDDLFFAGDYTAGLGRVHLAIESGWRAAELVGQALKMG